MVSPLLSLFFAACSASNPTDSGGTKPGVDEDGTAPSVSLTSPTPGEALSETVTLAATASDDVGVTELSFSANGALVATLVAEPYETTWDTTSWVNGNYTVAVTAWDAAGNNRSAEAQVTIDNAGGLGEDAVTIVNPVDGATVCGDITVEAAVSVDPATASLAVDGVELGVDADAPYTWDWDTTTVANGEHTLTVTVTDDSGAQGQVTSVVTVANDGGACDNLPTIQFTTPEDGQYLDGTVALAADASDDAGVLAVRFFVDSGLLVEDTSIPYAAEWDASLFAEGPHTLTATAIDTADQEASAGITVTIDRTPPSVTVLSPSDGSNVDGAVAVEVDASDNLELVSVALYADGDLVGSLPEAPWSFSWDAGGFGAHTLEAVATDAAGLESTDTITVWVDAAPEVEITEPDDGDTVSETTDITVSAFDDDEVTEVSVYVDGSRLGTDSASPWSVEWELCDVDRGEHTITAYAEDSTGNTTSDAVTVDVDRAPEIELEDPDGAISPTQPIVAWVDDDDPIEKVEFQVDGVLVGTAVAASAGTCALTCDCARWTVDWDASGAAEGTHTVTATLTNDKGETATATLSGSFLVVFDADEDGDDAEAWGGGDCDDNDGNVSSKATEVCDEVDNDCDGVIDNVDGGTASAWYVDLDGDGYGGTTSTVSCTAPDGYVGVSGDCDDADATVHPGAVDAVVDGVDQDCNGTADDGVCNVYIPLENGESATRVYTAVMGGDTYTETMSISGWTGSEGYVERSLSGSGLLSGDLIEEHVQCNADGYAILGWTDVVWAYDGTFSSPRTELIDDSELSVGGSWTYSYTATYSWLGSLAGTYTAEGTITFVEEAEVTVAAGTFTAILTEDEYHYDDGGTEYDGVTQSWYVAGLGLVKRLNTDLSDGSTKESVELTSYSGYTPR